MVTRWVDSRVVTRQTCAWFPSRCTIDNLFIPTWLRLGR